jgi:magnesium chelatase family protein
MRHWFLGFSASLQASPKRHLCARGSSARLIAKLSLDGARWAVRGALCVAVCARREGIPNLIVLAENAGEALWLRVYRVFRLKHLSEVVALVKQPDSFPPSAPAKSTELRNIDTGLDFRDVRGQANCEACVRTEARRQGRRAKPLERVQAKNER